MKRVAVLGRGNGAFAMASDLSHQGFEVSMWSKPFGELKKIQKTRTINVSGPLIQGEAKIHNITEDIEEAVRGADLICAPVPAFTQTSIAESLSHIVEDGQVIFLSPGTFGSYLIYHVLRKGVQKRRCHRRDRDAPVPDEKNRLRGVSDCHQGLPLTDGCLPRKEDRRGD